MGRELFKGSNESVLFSLHRAKRCSANCFVVARHTYKESVCVCERKRERVRGKDGREESQSDKPPGREVERRKKNGLKVI